jgi:hypothetical protein
VGRIYLGAAPIFSCDRMPMPIWKTGVTTSRATIVSSALLLCVSCGPPEQGYWTKQGIPQALTDEQYAADSQHCERFAAQMTAGNQTRRERNAIRSVCLHAEDSTRRSTSRSLERTVLTKIRRILLLIRHTNATLCQPSSCRDRYAAKDPSSVISILTLCIRLFSNLTCTVQVSRQSDRTLQSR